MRVLLDECLPKRLKQSIAGHEVCTVTEMGWSGKKNGELLRLMTANNFQIFLTGDQNLRYEQNLVSADVAVIVWSLQPTGWATWCPWYRICFWPWTLFKPVS